MRDVAEDQQAYADLQTSIVKHFIALLPLIGLLVISLNLFIRVHGNVGVAIAIAQNLSFGALTLIVLLNIVTTFLFGLIIALSSAVFDTSQEPRTRVGLTWLLVATLFVLFFVTSWIFWIFLVLMFIAMRFFSWRMSFGNVRRSKPQTIEAKLLSDVAPTDVVLRKLWINGRATLRAAGTPVTTTLVEEVAERPIQPAELTAVAAAWTARGKEIEQPQASRLTKLAFAGIIGFVGYYGFSLVAQPIQFAPLESVTVDGVPDQVGYVLLSEEHGIFLPRDNQGVRYVDSADLDDRELCRTVTGWWSATLLQVQSRNQIDGADCQAP